MRVEKQHVFTVGMSAPKGTKPTKLSKTFRAGAPINMSSHPLAGRVTIAKKVTERGKRLTNKVKDILGKIPSPFLGRGSK